MEPEVDIVESLIRSAGRRVDPPEDACRQVFAAAHDSFRKVSSRRQERVWLLWAGAAAVLVFAVALMVRWTPPVACGLLPGVFRATLLDAGDIRERVLTKDDVAAATRLWLVNSLREWMPAALVE